MSGVIAGANDSGFHGYKLSALYPGMYGGATNQDETIPEAAEQEALGNVEAPVPPVVDGKKKLGVMTLFISLVVLLFLFGKG